MTASAKGPWHQKQVEMFIKDAQASLGAGWDYLVPDIQAHVIRSKALCIIQANHREQGVPLADVDWLVNAMLDRAGLSDH